MSELVRDGDAVVWRLGVDEHLLLVVLLQQLDDALDGPTDDPVVRRLFPAVFEDDEDEDEALRAIIAGDLLLRRHEAIAELVSILLDVDPPPGPTSHGPAEHEPGPAEHEPGDDEPGDDAVRDGDDAAERDVDRPRPTVEVFLEDDAASLALSVLNDVRLALASSVGLTAVELPQLVDDEDERSREMLAVIDYLAAVQMQLLHAVDPSSVLAAHPLDTDDEPDDGPSDDDLDDDDPDDDRPAGGDGPSSG